MPENASVGKQLATRAYGGDVILSGSCVADALRHALELAREGYFFVHPFDDDEIMAGQGTVGVEIVSDLGAVDEVWVPVGGGGLIAGVAVAVKETHPAVRIVGIQAAGCPSALEARKAGRPVPVEPCRTIADGIAVPQLGERPFEVIERYVDELVTVEEDRIATAILQLLERKKLLAEGAGAVPLAALLSRDPSSLREKRICLVISGGNVDLNVLDRIVERGLIGSGRVMRFEVVLQDVPGALAGLLGLLSQERANVLRIHHDRLARDLALGATSVEIWVETRGFGHIERISAALRDGGFALHSPAAPG
jgi:threonine dehydratase